MLDEQICSVVTMTATAFVETKVKRKVSSKRGMAQDLSDLHRFSFTGKIGA